MDATPKPTAEMTLASYSEALASEAPTPGGGSVAAVAASLAAALASMVVRVSQDRAAYQAHAGLHEEALEKSEATRRRCLALAEDDAAAFNAYLAARRLPREPRDREIERDAESGKLDKLLKNSMADHQAGKSREI